MFLVTAFIYCPQQISDALWTRTPFLADEHRSAFVTDVTIANVS
jgi:hypothetical protein